MAIFIPRGGSFTWGRSGLMRWSSPIDRRHTLGTRVRLSLLFPGPSDNHWIEAVLSFGERQKYCSFSTQFGGDFVFDFRVFVEGGSATSNFRIIGAVNGVDYLVRSGSNPPGHNQVFPFKMTFLDVGPQSLIEFFAIGDTSGWTVRLGMNFLPVFSDRVGLFLPRAYLPVVSRSLVNVQASDISQSNVGLDQTPPIRVVSPSWVRRVPH